VGDQDATEAYGLHPRLSRDALVSQLAAFSDPKDMDALVFTTADGTHIGQHAFRRTLAPLLAATTPPQTGTECARRREIGSCQGKPDLGAKLRHESKRLLERSRAEGPGQSSSDRLAATIIGTPIGPIGVGTGPIVAPSTLGGERRCRKGPVAPDHAPPGHSVILGDLPLPSSGT
jgi:hypothetical protein